MSTSPPPATSGPDRSTGRMLKRYLPIGVIVVVLAAVIGFAALGGDDGEGDETAAEGPTSTGAPEATGDLPITYAEAEEEGTVDDYDWGDRCDTETGQVKLPTIYAAPCVPVFDGDNGGATSPGVTADTITIVRYSAQPDSDLQAILAGAGVRDTPEQGAETFEQYLELYTSVTETYGRDFEVVPFIGTGAADDEIASRADARQIAEDIQPLLVVGGPALDRGAFALELAANEIMCLECGLAVPDSLIQENAPYLWGGATPSVDQFLQNLGAWTGAADEVQGGSATAQFAGDEAMHDQERVIGVIHFEQDPPIFDETADEQQGTFDRNIATRESYIFNLATMPDDATELIAKMKDQGVTTIVFLGDPIMPIYLTREATAQEYFPEWIVTGTALTDTTQLARQYDPEQWAHAFGISNLPARVPRELGDSWRLYEWYYGEGSAPPPAQATYALIGPDAARVALGVQMAGPDLTAQTFTTGLFRVPPTGGGPTAPQVSYGNWGEFPATDYFGIDDSVEIWWDPDEVGPDENGNVGQGMWRYANGGARFTEGDPPTPASFVEEGSVTILDEIPEEDRPPEYPPPPGSPAAG